VSDLIHLEDLWKTYPVGPGVTALRGVNLSIAPGEFLAIMGSSGSGKSTMLNLLGCLDRPTRGHYWLDGRDVAQLSDDALSDVRNYQIGFVFQQFNLLPQLSIVENIEVPLFYQGMPRRERRHRSAALAEQVGLADRVDHLPSELSGGQQQRVAIARALANDPVLLLADEPTGNLDSHTSEDILEVFLELHGRGRAIVVVTHEETVAAHAQRVVRLRDGEIASDTAKGTP
jgi:putative ABC transport system ATP-binding protein